MEMEGCYKAQLDCNCFCPADVELSDWPNCKTRAPAPYCPVAVYYYTYAKGGACVTPPVDVDRIWFAQWDPTWRYLDDAVSPV